MADWNRQGGQERDWRERLQFGRQERRSQSDEWQRESQQFQPYGSQGDYGGGQQASFRAREFQAGYGAGARQQRGYEGDYRQADYSRSGYPESRYEQTAYDQGGYGQSAYGPSGERTGYGGYGSPAGRETGWQSGYSSQARSETGWQSGYGEQGRIQRRAPKGYTRSDERIREDLCERLMHSDMDVSEVIVEVRGATVILEGSVPERRMKHRIEDMADQTAGVNDVENNLRVVRQEWDADRSGRADVESQINGLNRCLRSELSAIETYRQALDRDRQNYGSHMEFQRLSENLRDHEDAHARLRDAIRSWGGEPSNDAGAWGTWSKIIMGAAKLFGDRAALKALKEGEESGLEEYERYMREHARSQDDLRLVSELMARQQRHIRGLDEILAALG
jgi:osmotically-inducible protein OsmY